MQLQHPQKLCDAHDRIDLRTGEILRERLRMPPGFRRKGWEFAPIHHALELNGAPHPRARGIASGARRERLVHALSERAEHMLATDLCGGDAARVGARTNAPGAAPRQMGSWPAAFRRRAPAAAGFGAVPPRPPSPPDRKKAPGQAPINAIP